MNIFEEAKYYNYVKNLFSSVCEYYNYSYIKTKENIASFSNDFINKVYYNDNTVGISILNEITTNGLAEIISLAYRFLEELGLDITVNLFKTNQELEEYLTYLDIDFEYLKGNKEIFTITYNDTILVKGNNNNDLYGWELNIDNLINILKESNKGQNIGNNIDVYIVGENKEERLKTASLIQDLRWCEIKCESDIIFINKEEQIEESNKLNARLIILLNSEELKKGIITVRDNITKEEVKVDENEIIDYIISNL